MLLNKSMTILALSLRVSPVPLNSAKRHANFRKHDFIDYLSDCTKSKVYFVILDV